MRRALKTGFWLLVPTVTVITAWQTWAWWSWASSPTAHNNPTLSPAPVRLQIAQGTSSKQIGRDLEAQKLIRSSAAWDLWARWLAFRNRGGGFRAGTYQVAPTEGLPAIAEKIWSGKTIQQSFTIPEGWSLRQMAAYFESQDFFKGEEFLAAARRIPRDRFPWLPDKLTSLEGFLYPDTYLVPDERVSPDTVLKIMLKRFEDVALPVWEKYRDRPNPAKLDFFGWVTLASIVEKEAVVPQERPLIAGVFHNRLAKGQKLESDPTVEYGLQIRQTADRPLTFAQVRTPSPYNTYLNPGLPPGPIAAPGKASLEATLNPETTEALFFVARYDGTHVFSKTLAEHEAAVVRIRRERNASQQIKRSPSPAPSGLPKQN